MFGGNEVPEMGELRKQGKGAGGLKSLRGEGRLASRTFYGKFRDIFPLVIARQCIRKSQVTRRNYS